MWEGVGQHTAWDDLDLNTEGLKAGIRSIEPCT